MTNGGEIMAIKIKDVLDYLDQHPICSECGDVKTLLEVIREVYVFYNGTEGDSLCREREQVAFEQGVVVGMQLMTEVNWVQ